MFYRNIPDILKTITDALDVEVNFKSWDSEINNIDSEESYPMFILAPMVNVMATANDELTDAYSISWVLVDKAEEDATESEILDVLNSIGEMSKTIFLTFENEWGYKTKRINGEQIDFNVTEPYTAQQVVMEAGDNRTGVAVSFTIENVDNSELCECPISIPDCPPATVIDSDEVTIVSVESGGVFACTPCEDATYENSDQSFQQTIASGDTFVADDVSHIDSDGTPTPTPANEVFICTPSVAQTGFAYQRPPLTGQTITYIVEDDNFHLLAGTYDYTPPSNPLTIVRLDTAVVNPFITLKFNNAFGNLNRFTDDGGLQTYANDLVIDHLTGLMWYRVRSTGSALWAAQVAAAAAETQGGFSDWRMPNEKELESVLSLEGATNNDRLNYAPFNIVIGTRTDSLFTSSTGQRASSGQYSQMEYELASVHPFIKTGQNAKYIPVRNFYN